MFWGLEMEPAKVYKQKVEKSFHVSMACLQPNKCGDANYTSLILRKDETDIVLCNLQKDKAIQVQLDLMFGSGDEIAFTLTGGKNKVYLSGYILEDDDQLFNESDSEGDAMEEEIPMLVEGKRKADQSPLQSTNKKAKLKLEPSDDDSDESDDEEGDDEVDSDEDDSDDAPEEEEDEGESGSESDDELDSDEETTPVKISATSHTPDKGKNKSPAVNQQLSKDKMQQKTPVSTPDSQVNGKTSKSKKKKKNKGNSPGADTNDVTPKGQKTPDTPKETTPQRIKLEGGVIATEIKIGTGPPAKAGKRVALYYTGRLQQNNKQFDSSNQGKGFVFQLGRGEVIKGWDIGVAGMKVGGKRKIVVPAPLAYGNKGSPPVIPPNSTLVFELELKNVY